MDHSEFVAQEAAALTFEDIPSDVVEKAKYLILDNLGCQLAFSTLSWGKAAYQYISSRQAPGNSTVVYYGDKINAEDAAFVNSVFAHGFEMDDCEMKTTSHPGVATVPVVLAVGERENASGADVITALVTGYETTLRFGFAADSMRLRFHHATGVSGSFGAATATGKLLGFDAKTMANALGIATTEACGNTEYTCSGGTVKRTLGAVAVCAGIRSALLAQAGITGPGEAFSGKKSYVKGICGEEPEMDWFTVPFKDKWLTLAVGYKPYCCCAAQHTVIDATEELRAQGIDPDHISHIDITQYEREVINVGRIVNPHDVIEAQFCGRFACALRLYKGGNGFYDYTLENIHDERIRALMDKIDYHIDQGELPQADAPARVRITMDDGTVHEATAEYATGSVNNPMSDEAMKNKFRGLASKALSAEQIEKVIDAVMRLDTMESVTELTALLCATEQE